MRVVPDMRGRCDREGDGVGHADLAECHEDLSKATGVALEHSGVTWKVGVYRWDGVGCTLHTADLFTHKSALLETEQAGEGWWGARGWPRWRRGKDDKCMPLQSRTTSLVLPWFAGLHPARYTATCLAARSSAQWSPIRLRVPSHLRVEHFSAFIFSKLVM